MLEITSNLRTAFDSARAQIEDTPILGYAILTDDTGIMFTPVVGTDRGQYQNVPADDIKFLPTYWDVPTHAELAGSGLGVLNQLYEQCSDFDNDDHWHEQFRSRAYLLLVSCLEQLVAEGYFSSDAPEPFVAVWVVDSDVPNTRARSWAKRLNSPTMYHQFVSWLDKAGVQG